eukprot:TRINITY_DN30718_c0_g1_i1.p1 TRINITY_DN30718_c0_g1~~TRINITY_DN30718_c0_g1_i1.p1  ORF type:complete len:165 (-),score=35.87 TRINITY_DN30718_c0_g1_i1:28-489(-)
MATREDAQRLQSALAEYYSTQGKSSPPDVNEVVSFIARTGAQCFEWDHLRALLLARTKEALGEGDAEYNEQRDAVLENLQRFQAAPFTLQRLCEILREPHRHHATKEKLVFAVEKLVTVSSTLERVPFPFEEENGVQNDVHMEEDRPSVPSAL